MLVCCRSYSSWQSNGSFSICAGRAQAFDASDGFIERLGFYGGMRREVELIRPVLLRPAYGRFEKRSSYTLVAHVGRDEEVA